MTTLYYLTDYTDEVMPCAPNLPAWAEWLSKPDESWPHEIPKVGQLFEADREILLGDVRAERTVDGWMIVGAEQPQATHYFLRWNEGGSGWDIEHSGDTIAAALSEIDDDEEGPLFLAATRPGGGTQVRYELDLAGLPRLVDLEDEDASHCIACDQVMQDGQAYYSDASGGFIHAACTGPEREGYTGPDGEPLGPNDPIPTPAIWSND